MKAILVTGSREFDDEGLVRDAILNAVEIGTKTVVIAGHCDEGGADILAERAVAELNRVYPWPEHGPIWLVPIPADWDRHGKAAGPRRNIHMVDFALHVAPLRDITVLAFFKTGAGNRGTRNCVAAALAAGIPDSQIRRFWA